MGLKQFFSHLEAMYPDDVREYMNQHDSHSYTLLDVRQPKEYEEDHIPGAKFIPLPELSDRLDELDPDKPTITYCAVGGRSSMAARFLASRGFKEVYNLKGGINAWEGELAAGPADFHLPFIEEYDTLEKMIALTYQMENNLEVFYQKLVGQTGDGELDDLLKSLARWEEKHKERIVGEAAKRGISEESLQEGARKSVMEGGFDMDSFIEKNESYLQSKEGVLEVAMMIESQALDLYLRMAETVEDEEAKDALFSVAEEEKTHLRSLGKLMGD